MPRGSSPSRQTVGRSQRQLRVGEEIRHALALILQEGDMRDPLLRDASITVTEVQASPDLKNASAYVMPLGGKVAVEGASVDDLIAALNKAAPYFRGQIGRALALKYTPHLKFYLDDTFDEVDRIGALLNRAKSDGGRYQLPDDANDDHDGQDED